MSSFSDELRAHLKAAKAYAELSYAKRLKVGALLIRDGRIISVGRNGNPTRWNNVCEDKNDNTLPTVIHAEANVILFAAKSGISTDDTMLVTTHSPCWDCSKLLVQAGIKKVYYETEYRDISSLQFLKDNNVKVEQING